MKKKVLTVAAIMTMLVVSLIALTGCGKDKEKDKNKLVGTWEYTSGLFSYQFNDDFTGAYNVGSQSMKFTYEDKGESIVIKYDGNSTPMELKYRIEDSKLIITDSFGSDVTYNKK